MNRIKTLIKFLLSFFRGYSRIEDYPVRFTRQNQGGARHAGAGEIPAWRVQIINWWQMSGVGDSRAKAYANLRETFDRYKELHKNLPRPGTSVPVICARADQVMQYEEIARDFFSRIVGRDYDSVWISDQSSLRDFLEYEPSEYQERIRRQYGVDVTDIETGNLVQIFQRIQDI